MNEELLLLFGLPIIFLALVVMVEKSENCHNVSWSDIIWCGEESDKVKVSTILRRNEWRDERE